jgi:hypothetical protein
MPELLSLEEYTANLKTFSHMIAGKSVRFQHSSGQEDILKVVSWEFDPLVIEIWRPTWAYEAVGIMEINSVSAKADRPQAELPVLRRNYFLMPNGACYEWGHSEPSFMIFVEQWIEGIISERRVAKRNEIIKQELYEKVFSPERMTNSYECY